LISRGIHEANDLVAVAGIDTPERAVNFVAASTKPMTLWRQTTISTDFASYDCRGIHEANDLVAVDPGYH